MIKTTNQFIFNMRKIIILVIMISANNLFAQPNNTYQADLEYNPYMPEIVSQFPNVRDLTISADKKEVYFTVESYKKELSVIVYIKRINNKWSKPEIAPFSGNYKNLEPSFSPDGLKLFFASNRPSNDLKDKPKNMDIWYVERKSLNSAWSLPINVGSQVNTEHDEFYPSVSQSGNLFFTAQRSDTKGKEDIYMSKWVENKYTRPISLSDSINSPGYEFNAYVAPDESFIIYTAYGRSDDLGGGDLYISYKTKEDKWTKAKNLGKQFNSSRIDYCPFVDIQTQILYFTSERSKLKTSVLDNVKDLNKLLNYINKSENGMSKIYKISFADFLK